MEKPPVNYSAEPGIFGAWLRQQREDQSFSQADLAARCGKSHAWLARIESAKAPPPDRTDAAALATALGAPHLANDLYDFGALERLRAADPELLAWHQQQMKSQAEGDPLTTLLDSEPFQPFGDIYGTLCTLFAAVKRIDEEMEGGRDYSRRAAVMFYLGQRRIVGGTQGPSPVETLMILLAFFDRARPEELAGMLEVWAHHVFNHWRLKGDRVRLNSPPVPPDTNDV